MKTGPWIVLITLGIIVAEVMLADAQDLETGTWSGKLRLPDGSAQRIRLIVEEVDNGSQQLTLLSGDSTYSCDDVSMEGPRLAFTWIPGNEPIPCFLQRQDDESFEGNCTLPGDELGVGIVLVPPTEAEEGNENIDNLTEGASDPSE